MSALFIRHGTAAGTREQICQGSSPCQGLTPEGIEEILTLLAQMNAKALKPSCIFSSPIPRALQTAAILSEEMEVPMIINDSLRERYYGAWEGLPFADFEKRLSSGETPPDGESRKGFHLRSQSAVTGILRQEPDAFIVSHGGVWQALHDFYNLPAPWLYPGHAFRISFDESGAFSSGSL